MATRQVSGRGAGVSVSCECCRGPKTCVLGQSKSRIYGSVLSYTCSGAEREVLGKDGVARWMAALRGQFVMNSQPRLCCDPWDRNLAAIRVVDGRSKANQVRINSP